MLAAFRAFAKSWVASVLFGVLIIAFAFFGISSYRSVLSPKMSNAVVSAGSRTVTPVDFKRAFDNFKGRLEQQYQQPISAELAAENGLDRRVLEGLATSEAFSEDLNKIGIQPSITLVAAEIHKIPAFFDQVTGRFDKKAYAERVAAINLTVPQFESQLRDQIAEQHAASGLVAGLKLPRSYAALAAIFTVESRDLAYFSLQPSAVPKPGAPTDAQLIQLMNENKAQLTRPEFRTLTVVRFSPSQVKVNGPIDQADLQKRFDFRKDTLSTPETRTFVSIPTKDQATARAVAKGLSKEGADPALVAKSAGVEVINYANKPKAAIPDAKVAALAFQTPAGQVATVKGDLGFAVVKVFTVTPGRAVTLDEVKPALEAEIRKDQAAEKVYQLTQAYDDARQGGMNLAAAAAKAGVPTTSIGPVAQNGRDDKGQPVQGLSQKLMDAAWSLPAGGESEVEEAGNGEFFAVRVEKIAPPAMPPLAEIREKLAEVWTNQQIAKALEAKADALADRIKKGESLEDAAKSAGVTVTRQTGIDRRNAGQNPALSQDLLAHLFTSNPGEVFTARGKSEFLVGKLESVHLPDPSLLGQTAEQVRGQMTQGYLREIGETAQVSARQKIKVTIDAAKAREAIGLEPTDTKAAAGKPAGGAKAAGGKPPLAK